MIDDLISPFKKYTFYVNGSGGNFRYTGIILAVDNDLKMVQMKDDKTRHKFWLSFSMTVIEELFDDE